MGRDLTPRNTGTPLRAYLRVFGILVVCAGLISEPAMARKSQKTRIPANEKQELAQKNAKNASGQGNKGGEEFWYDEADWFAPVGERDKPRSDVVMPLLSVFLPGVGQWVEGQWQAGALYTGLGLSGLMFASNIYKANDLKTRRELEKEAFDNADTEEKPLPPFASDNIAERKVAYGEQILQSMGGFSAYHAFRTSVHSRRHLGQYEFLRYEETPGEIMLAAFDFRYMKRASTIIPLTVIAALSYLQINSEIPDDTLMVKREPQGPDYAFAMGFSLNAGTHEEAIFRGWMQPMFREYTGSNLLSNLLSSGVFALAHLGTNDVPIPQLLLGYHLGNVTMDDDWRLGEAVFIHTWWDVFAFIGTYHYKQQLPEPEAALINPVLWLPPVHLVF